ncbi:MAG TPA: Clp protease N-terminal domain-containing protein [Acidimicrobiales bacterium]|nr:Clp protease N-terminal domain-containing protein [Acidimicrobiales bacterium]
MFQRAASRVFVVAQEEVAVRNHEYVGTEHILLGLARESEGVTPTVLDALGISNEQLEDKIEELRPRRATPVEDSPPLSPNVRRVLEFALREAVVLGHRDIGPEHLLLGIIRKSDCTGARVLYGLGPDLDLVRHEVVKKIGSSSDM